MVPFNGSFFLFTGVAHSVGFIHILVPINIEYVFFFCSAKLFPVSAMNGIKG